MTQPRFPILFGWFTARPTPARVDEAAPAPRWVDVVLLLGLVAVGYGIMRAAAEWRAPLTSGAQIDRSVRRLPYYAGLSTLRMAIAYAISLVFSLVYARMAAASRIAERIMLPMLDILQSIPILSFMPGVVLGLAAMFPGRTIGLELAAVILIFTSQAWNLAFSFHQSLITIPRELGEAASIYRLGAWRRFTKLELPFGAIALIANSMMSWAGGWFFLMASEQFTLGDKNLRLPGLGSYLAGAADAGNATALAAGLLTLVTVIVLLDQLLWRPLVAWSDRFKFEQTGAGASPQSAVLDAVVGSAPARWFNTHVGRPFFGQLDRAFSPKVNAKPVVPPSARRRAVPFVLVVAAGTVLFGIVMWAAVAAARVVSGLSWSEWRYVLLCAGATFVRTTVALLLAAAWTIPVGVSIGMNPRLAAKLQPLVQIAASVPATAVFPVLLFVMLALPGGLNLAAVGLMLLGTQWYVLFNVIAGAMAIPSDLREAAITYRVTGWRRWKTLILPAIFPYLVTGMITATGGAWNASIVSEYVTFAGKKVSTVGLGALIAQAADAGRFPLLLAGTLVMSAIVITGNRLVWRRLYALAESRFRLE